MPYKVQGPALISFSGGRTSAFMLHEIVRAYDGKLPDDVIVNFANTGKEREETLRFVHECGMRWGVHINWIEWRDTAAGFEIVGYNSASRNGEPFKALIDKKQRLPNWKERWCTASLKVQPMTDFAASLGLATGAYTEVIGLRHDEGLRVLKGLANADKHGSKVAYPLTKAKIVRADVMAFWAAQPFDLGLESWEGNCDLCFLKGRKIKKQIIRNNPSVADWWSEQETVERGNGRGWFDRRDRVAALAAEVAKSPTLFETLDQEEYDVECGLHCAEESA